MQILSEDWSGLRLRTTPFCWAVTAPGVLLSLADACSLARSFPTEGMARLDESTRTTGKRYRNFSLPVEPTGSLAHFSPVWQELIADLRSAAYRERMARLLAQPIAGRLELRFVRHAPGDWLSPHTDNPDKLFTHVFYMNENWSDRDAGWLEILEREDPNAVAERVLPTLGTSVIFRPSQNSWHQVKKVSAKTKAYRHSFLIHAEP